MLQRIEICGIPLDCVDMQSAVQFVDKTIRDNEKCSIFAVNPEKVIAARRNEELRNLLASSELLIPDGIGVVLAAKLQGAMINERVPGCELAIELCKLAELNKYKVYLLGASESTNKSAVSKLLDKYPELNIVGQRDGYFSEDERENIINEINQSNANIVLVALGSPKQELWIKSNQSELDANILQGIGGTLDVIAGNVTRAPYIWRKFNLEWLFRLLCQPGRILRQKALPEFIWRVVVEQLKR